MSAALLKDVPGVREIPVFNDTGVYFLLSGDEVVYVGQSVSVHRRVASHVGRFHFDRVVWIPVDGVALDATEAAFIRLFNPEENRGVPTTDDSLDQQILAAHGVCAPDGTELPGKPLPANRRLAPWRREWIKTWRQIGLRAVYDARDGLRNSDLLNMKIDTFLELYRDKDVDRIRHFQESTYSQLNTIGDIVRLDRKNLLKYKNVGAKTVRRWFEVADELGLIGQ